MEKECRQIGRASEAAVAVAAAHGLGPVEPEVLATGSNVILRLHPLPLVARVAGGTALVRSGSAWLAREVAVSAFVAARGAPALAPSPLLPPGPHEHDGLAISFWPLVEAAATPERKAAAAALLRCHQALEGFEGDLPQMAPLEETASLLAHPLVEGAAAGSDRALLLRTIASVRERVGAASPALRPLHGDAHAGNCFALASGPLWADWEDACAGPIEWDLACLVCWPLAAGDRAEVDRCLHAYGAPVDRELLRTMVELRLVQAAVWHALVRRAPHPRAVAHLRALCRADLPE